MKSDKKQQTIKLKPNKKILQRPKEKEFETTSMSYFRIIKELEKQNSEQKLSHELKKKEPKPKKNNLTELIYEKNSKKLGNYYNENQNNLLLYGSSKYDVLSMDKLVKEMGNYKSRIINKINENKNVKNAEIKEILDQYENSQNKVILTPLAENEKERSEMEILEKQNYDEAKRMGVVMRRIEYTSLLNNRNNQNKNGDNKEMVIKLKNSVQKIEDSWLRYRSRKILKQRMKDKPYHIELQYLSTYDNLEKLEELEQKYEELNNLYEDSKNEVERLSSENKDLQLSLEEAKKTKEEELNKMAEEYKEKFRKIEKVYNELLAEKNNLQESYDQLYEEKNSLNDKYNETIENLNQREEELKNIKNEYDILSNSNNEKEEKIKELEQNIENLNNEKNELENTYLQITAGDLFKGECEEKTYQFMIKNSRISGNISNWDDITFNLILIQRIDLPYKNSSCKIVDFKGEKIFNININCTLVFETEIDCVKKLGNEADLNFNNSWNFTKR